MFNTSDKYGELFCWFLQFIYFVVMLMNKHKFIYSFTIDLFQSWLNMLLPWADMEVSGWYRDQYGTGHVIIYMILDQKSHIG